ncbi:hypothetical protein GUITHDRAFT_109800 [Guillardia theta CCMP2712]|uniref:Tyrosine-protein kinase ephrin type A/B receptor-like domain-containing protein n=1 Tax=Guillardia theta (strain CCMP2712) TaxID=905079 RepID=L1J8G0_GUITC|nr:hypothetical protein GUITHDRAFT_109800 [Guillardia theta CCMP2712]EKX44350.1 hypothetical protein GUITHDRAFT_109800 [Guillardia theta CCMP2712]|eukprot:XP_005831330.1 hypothetical protein GUITHDRAFT_109800 [Guillardia theta CCMP2712]
MTGSSGCRCLRLRGASGLSWLIASSEVNCCAYQGYYLYAVMDAELCQACPIGSYKSAPGSANCSACPRNMDTPATGSTDASACPCRVGTYRNGSGACELCPGGSGSAAGASSLYECSSVHTPVVQSSLHASVETTPSVVEPQLQILFRHRPRHQSRHQHQRRQVANYGDAMASNQELLSTLVSCVASLAVASLARVSLSKLYMIGKRRAPSDSDVLFPPFLAWELPIAVTQVQGLSLAIFLAIRSGCVVCVGMGCLLLPLVKAELDLFCYYAHRGHSTLISWRAWEEAKGIGDKIGAVGAVFARGEWVIDDKSDKFMASWLYMKRFRVLLEEVCAHAWWYGVYSIVMRALTSIMSAFVLVDLLLVIAFTPQIDWLAWLSHLLAALGNLGICLSLLTSAVFALRPDLLNMTYLYVSGWVQGAQCVVLSVESKKEACSSSCQ